MNDDGRDDGNGRGDDPEERTAPAERPDRPGPERARGRGDAASAPAAQPRESGSDTTA